MVVILLNDFNIEPCRCRQAAKRSLMGTSRLVISPLIDPLGKHEIEKKNL